jgi:hypothetical protein
MGMPAPVDSPPIPMPRAPEAPAHFNPPPMGPPPGARPPMAPPQRPMPPASAPEEPKPERKGRIIVAVLVISGALLAAAFGGLYVVDKVFNRGAFAVGDCVKQSESAAIKVDCGDSGVFKVTASVSSLDQCPDQTQPHVEQGKQILCLAPADTSQVTPTAPAATNAPAAGPTATPTK